MIALIVFGIAAFALPSNKYKLMIAPGTISETLVTLLWDKQYAKGSVEYEILLNNKLQGTATKINYTVTYLLPNTYYSTIVRIKDSKHLLLNGSFINIILTENAKVVINDAEKVKFTNVKSSTGIKPTHVTNNSTAITY